METPKKKSGRKPKYGEPTIHHSFRVSLTMNEFYKSFKGSNQFMIDLTESTPEYKAFVAKKKEQELVNQPNLFLRDKNE